MVLCGRKLPIVLTFLFLEQSGCRLRSLRFCQSLLELVHTAGGIDKLLCTRIKRVAGVADANHNNWPNGSRFDYIATRATYFRVLILRMDISFHTKR